MALLPDLSFRSVATALLLVGGLSGLTWAANWIAVSPTDGVVRASLSPVEALAGSDTVGYARALEPRAFRFPQDHGPHPEFRTEWWYVTANLTAPDGRAFGAQLTFFRSALVPELPERESAWNTNQLWMAHAAITDVAGERHLYAERFAREAVGLAGARAAPLRVWLEDWEIRASPDATSQLPHPFPLELSATDEGWAIHLILDEGKPPVFHGEDGLSQKGPEPGNASYYFSFTRLPTQGSLVLEGETVPVTGLAWIDREWSTSALGPAHTGWDWFSIQLSDGRELMFFELRREDGTRDPLNHGSLVAPDGTREPLNAHQVEIEALGSWESPLDGARYPSGWRLRVPHRGIDLEITPKLRNQEMNLAFRYWEGTVWVEGLGVEGDVVGDGYVELTGYEMDPPDERPTRGAPPSPRE